jgi:hypothetical protein
LDSIAKNKKAGRGQLWIGTNCEGEL